MLLYFFEWIGKRYLCVKKGIKSRRTRKRIIRNDHKWDDKLRGIRDD